MKENEVKVLLRKSGWWILVLLAVIPIFFWLGDVSLSLRFRSAVSTYNSFGQITGLIGMVFFAESLLLSARWKWFEVFFEGMNQVYIAHHMVGGLSLIFLLMHPIFLAMVHTKISYTDAIAFMLPGTDWAINLGIASLYALIALMIVTFFVALKYEIWLKTHKYLGFVFFLGGLHSLFVESDISRIPLLKWYIVVFSLVSLVAYTYRTLFPDRFVKKYEYSVTSVTALPDEVIQIIMNPLHGRMTYKAGQFIFIEFKQRLFFGEIHPFSIASAPDQNGSVAIAVKSLGDYTQKLKMLAVGTRAMIEGPYGVFNALESAAPEQIWIAGGIGVAPFVSMAFSLLDKPELPVQIVLFYATKTAEDTPYLEQLQAIADYDKRFQVIPHYSKEHGRLTMDTAIALANFSKPEVYVCGPPAMMKSLSNQCYSLGIMKSQVHTEEFSMS